MLPENFVQSVYELHTPAIVHACCLNMHLEWHSAAANQSRGNAEA